MNSAVRTPAKQVGAQVSRSWSRLTEWRRLLVRCGRKPTRKRVHALRVVTLRVLADLEYRIAAVGAMPAEETKAAGRWCKQASKLRRALSSVRAADVWIGKLGKLRKSLSAANAYIPRSNRECLRQIDGLENRLRRKRQVWEKELVAEIEGRRDRLEQLCRDLETAAEDSDSHMKNMGANQIAEQFAGAAADFRVLDASNLHEFRKRIKKIRYLAEIFAATDAEARRQAAVLKKMQSSIGEWHDWQELAAEARGNRNRCGELAEMLKTLAAESLAKAVDLCDRSSERLLKNREHAGEVEQPVPRKPPVRSGVSTAFESRRRA
jgi:CHAD domain-containing protein